MRLHLLGRHQLDNAAAAIAAAHVIREQGLGKITQESVLQGLQATSLPGRMQVSCAVTCCFAELAYAPLGNCLKRVNHLKVIALL